MHGFPVTLFCVADYLLSDSGGILTVSLNKEALFIFTFEINKYKLVFLVIRSKEMKDGHKQWRRIKKNGFY